MLIDQKGAGYVAVKANFTAGNGKKHYGFIWPVLKIVKIPLYASHFVSKTLLGRLEERVYTSKIHITWKSAHISALSTSLPFHVGQKIISHGFL